MSQLRQRGFTLVELLVVISIIALLIGILLPALGAAKDAAAVTRCNSNLHNLVLASSNYVANNKDYLPFSNSNNVETSGLPGADTPGWLYRNSLLINGKPNYVDTAPTAMAGGDLEKGSLWEFVNNDKRIFRCSQHKSPFNNGTDKLTSYLMQGAVNDYGNKHNAGNYTIPSLKLAQFKPGDALFWEEDEGANNWNDGANRPNEGIAARHGKTATVATMGGQARVIRPDEFNTTQSSAPVAQLAVVQPSDGGWPLIPRVRRGRGF